MIDVSNGNRGVLKRIIKEGTGELPEPNSRITIHYIGKIAESGAVFDSSRERTRPEEIKLGEGMITEGWELSLLSMKQGEISRFYIFSNYGYGELGCPPRIPARSNLLFEIEMLNIERIPLPLPLEKEESFEERIKKATTEKESGNSFYSKAAYRKAVKSYNRGIAHFNGLHDLLEEEEEELNKIKLPLLLNLTAANIQLKDYLKARQSAEQALAIDPKNIKALFRLGQAQRYLGNFDLARSKLNEASNLQPSDKAIKDELKQLDVDIIEYHKKTKDIFFGMFERKPPEKKKEDLGEGVVVGGNTSW